MASKAIHSRLVSPVITVTIKLLFVVVLWFCSMLPSVGQSGSVNIMNIAIGGVSLCLEFGVNVVFKESKKKLT